MLLVARRLASSFAPSALLAASFSLAACGSDDDTSFGGGVAKTGAAGSADRGGEGGGSGREGGGTGGAGAKGGAAGKSGASGNGGSGGKGGTSAKGGAGGTSAKGGSGGSGGASGKGGTGGVGGSAGTGGSADAGAGGAGEEGGSAGAAGQPGFDGEGGFAGAPGVGSTACATKGEGSLLAQGGNALYSGAAALSPEDLVALGGDGNTACHVKIAGGTPVAVMSNVQSIATSGPVAILREKAVDFAGAHHDLWRIGDSAPVRVTSQDVSTFDLAASPDGAQAVWVESLQSGASRARAHDFAKGETVTLVPSTGTAAENVVLPVKGGVLLAAQVGTKAAPAYDLHLRRSDGTDSLVCAACTRPVTSPAAGVVFTSKQAGDAAIKRPKEGKDPASGAVLIDVATGVAKPVGDALHVAAGGVFTPDGATLFAATPQGGLVRYDVVAGTGVSLLSSYAQEGIVPDLWRTSRDGTAVIWFHPPQTQIYQVRGARAADGWKVWNIDENLSYEDWVRPLGEGLTRDGSRALLAFDPGYMWQQYRAITIDDETTVKQLADKKFSAFLGTGAKIVYEIPFSGDLGVGTGLMQQHDLATGTTNDLGKGLPYLTSPDGTVLVYAAGSDMRRLVLP